LIRRQLATLAWYVGFAGYLGNLPWIFVRRWLTSKRLKPLLWGLPAVIAAVGVGVLALASQRTVDSDLATRYRNAAAAAAGREDTEAAKLWLEKASLLDPNDPAIRYSLALAEEQDGRQYQARLHMEKLAPDDRAGFPDAHFWLARHLMARKLPRTPELLDTLEHHLTHAVGSKHAAPQAHAMLGQLMMEKNDTDGAIRHLEEAVKTNPELGVGLGILYAGAGKPSVARITHQRARDHFRGLVQADPKDVEPRLRWAHCEILLENPREAERILKEGLALDPDPRLSSGLAQVYVLQFDRLAAEGPSKLIPAIRFLEAAIEHAPNDPEVLRRLNQVRHADGPSREAARRMLSEIVARGKATATVHIMLGNIACTEGNLQGAANHYQLALRLQPKMMQALNNLAWTLAHADPPELDRALELADAALAVAPADPEALETRGQILAKLGRWKDCIVDLEKALPLLPKRPALHSTLAQAYENIGDEILAEAHRRLADESKSDSR